MKLGGWWRLWIVLAVIYGCAVAVYTINILPSIETIQHQPKFVKMMSVDAQRLVSLGTEADLNKDKWAKALAEVGGGVLLEHGKQLRTLVLPNGYAFNLEANLPEEQRSLVASEYRRVLETILFERRIASVQRGLLLWLSPVILLLLLGLAVRWISHGFTRDRSRAP